MDKVSERTKQSKSPGDDDIGVQDYGAGGKRYQLDGLWKPMPSELGDQPMSRLMTNDYKKSGKKDGDGSLLDEVIEHGPPILNISKPKRVF